MRLPSLLLPLLVALGGAVAGGAAVAQGLPPVPVPRENPITAGKALLGKTLFWDEQLSSSRRVACATCHLPEFGGGDVRALGSVHPGYDRRFGTDDDVHGSPGVISRNADGSHRRDPLFGLDEQVTRRKAPSVLMAAYSRELFWDGRAGERFVDPTTSLVVSDRDAALESQALKPLISPVEMAHSGEDWLGIAGRLAVVRPLALATELPAALAQWLGQRTYPDLFREAFGTAAITPVRIAQAIATYERTLVPDQAPIDAYLAGNRNALTDLEKRGLALFEGVGRCAICHPSPLFGKDEYFNIGVRPWHEDLGRAEITRQVEDAGAFRAVSLRNAVLRAPYFHDGSVLDVRSVIGFYDDGGNFRERQSLQIQPLHLTPTEELELIAFVVNALTDPRVEQALPPFDHPKLYSHTARVPTGYGRATAGSGAFVPRLLVLDPPVLGNPGFSLTLADGLGQAPAILLLDLLPDTSGRNVLGVQFALAGTPALQAWSLGGLRDSGAGLGWTSRALALPPEPQLAGQKLYLQAVVADPGAVQGFAATAGTQFTLFASR